MSEFSSMASQGEYRMPPHSIESEQSVLGGLLIDAGAHDKLGGSIEEGDFYRADHRIIFRHIIMLVKAGKPVDVLTVAEYLDLHGVLDKAGGLPYLGSLAQAIPSTANIHFYAAVVREKSIMRKVIQISQEMADSAYNPSGKSSKEVLDDAENKVFKIAEADSLGKQGFIHVSPLLAKVIERVDQLYSQDNQKDITGLPTGFIDLDKQTSGLQPGELIIIAARPSMGKTAFAVNIAENVALDTGLPVAIFSMEMGGEQLAMRMIGSVGRINQQDLRCGKMLDEDWSKITVALGKLHAAPIFIDETPGLNVMDIRTRARRIYRENAGLGLIVIDYLQLMGSTERRQNDNRATEVAEITRALKSLARELRVPIITLSQLNRSLEKRDDKRPMMSDLRESGAIEQDADLILFIHREEYYTKDAMDKGKAEIIIGKHRNGPTGTIQMTFQGEYTRFENRAREDY
ncbi:MAG: replicative DNA helicase [Methylococcaceae bacterium]